MSFASWQHRLIFYWFCTLQQQALDNYAERVTGRWACLSIHGHLVATSSDFYELDTRESRLMLLLAAAQDGAPLRDTPVYLPQMSPNVSKLFKLYYYYLSQP